MSDRCPIGSLGLHTYNYERTECIWCGPNRLAWKPGRWVTVESGKTQAWISKRQGNRQCDFSNPSDTFVTSIVEAWRAKCP